MSPEEVLQAAPIGGLSRVIVYRILNEAGQSNQKLTLYDLEDRIKVVSDRVRERRPTFFFNLMGPTLKDWLVFEKREGRVRMHVPKRPYFNPRGRTYQLTGEGRRYLPQLAQHYGVAEILNAF
jgi:hypothetical protein